MVCQRINNTFYNKYSSVWLLNSTWLVCVKAEISLVKINLINCQALLGTLNIQLCASWVTFHLRTCCFKQQEPIKDHLSKSYFNLIISPPHVHVHKHTHSRLPLHFILLPFSGLRPLFLLQPVFGIRRSINVPQFQVHGHILPQTDSQTKKEQQSASDHLTEVPKQKKTSLQQVLRGAATKAFLRSANKSGANKTKYCVPKVH